MHCEIKFIENSLQNTYKYDMIKKNRSGRTGCFLKIRRNGEEQSGPV